MSPGIQRIMWWWSDKPLRIIIIMLLPCQTYKATLMVSAIHKERENCPPLPYTKKWNKRQDIWVTYKQNGLLCACNCFSIAGKSFHNPNVYIPYGLRRLLRLKIPTQTQKTTSYWSNPAIHTWSPHLQKKIPICLKRHRRRWKKQKPEKLWKC